MTNPDSSKSLPAMAHVPPQRSITHVYKPEDALRRGTLFPELDKPFSGKGAGARG